MITYTNNLDIYPGNPPIVIKLSQYDTDFSLVFNLFSSRGTLTIASGTTAVFREKKPDGNVMSVDATIDITNKMVTLTPSDTIAKQITAIAGKCCCELSLQKNNDELNTANFVLLVEKAPVDIDAVESDSVVRELYDIADQAEQIIDAAARVTEAMDPTLTLEGHAADAKVTGDRLRAAETMLWTHDLKSALLECFKDVAWLNSKGAQDYSNLKTALYADEFPKIVAVFTAGSDPIYTDDSLEVVKQYLTVTFYTSSSDIGTVIDSEDYSLSGALVDGTSTLVVYYDSYRTFVSVPVTDFYNQYELEYPSTAIKTIVRGNQNWQGETSGYNIRSTLYPTIKNRAWLGASHGKKKVRTYSDTGFVNEITNTNYYPVPIPAAATKMTVTLPNSTYRFGVNRYHFDGEKYDYKVQDHGWVAYGSGSITFNALSNQYAIILLMTTAGDFTDTNLPGSVLIVFE